MVQKIHDSRYTHASVGLHEKIAGMVMDLPDHPKKFYFPVFAFQMAIAVTVLVVLIGLPAGLVVAAKGSQPGTPFYSVKKVLQKIAPQVVEEPSVLPTPAINKPIMQPTPTQKPPQPTLIKHRVRGGEEDNERKEEGFVPSEQHIRSVAGEHDEQVRFDNQKEDQSNLPTVSDK